MTVSNLHEEKITVSIGLDSLAYILTNEFNRETFLELIEYMAVVNADSNFEWEVIEVLFSRLLKCDSEAAGELWRELEAAKEESDEACYTYDGIVGCIIFWPQGRGGASRVVAHSVGPKEIQFIVDSLNERKNDG